MEQNSWDCDGRRKWNKGRCIRCITLQKPQQWHFILTKHFPHVISHTIPHDTSWVDQAFYGGRNWDMGTIPGSWSRRLLPPYVCSLHCLTKSPASYGTAEVDCEQLRANIADWQVLTLFASWLFTDMSGLHGSKEKGGDRSKGIVRRASEKLIKCIQGQCTSTTARRMSSTTSPLLTESFWERGTSELPMESHLDIALPAQFQTFPLSIVWWQWLSLWVFMSVW